MMIVDVALSTTLVPRLLTVSVGLIALAATPAPGACQDGADPPSIEAPLDDLPDTRAEVDSVAREIVLMRDRDPALGLEAAREALPAARRLGHRTGEAALLTAMGMMHNVLGENGTALERYGEALELYRAAGDREGEADALRSEGVSFYDLGRYDEALERYLTALTISEELADSGSIARTASNIGNVHWAAGRNEDALGYHRRALEVFRARDERVGMAGVSINLGTIRTSMADEASTPEAERTALDNAAAHYSTALSIFEELGNLRGVAHASHNLGTLELRRDRPREALPLLRRGLEIRREVGDAAGEVESLESLGEVHLALDRPGEAVAALEAAVALATERGLENGTPNAWELLADAREADGDAGGALRAHREFTRIRQEAEQARTAERVAELTLQFESQRRERELADLRSTELAQELEIYRQRTVIFALACGAALIFTVLVLLTLRYRRSTQERSVLQEAARTDPLTGLVNRREMTRCIENCLAALESEGTPFALVMGDMDDFKSINDTLGHDAGDEALRHVASRIINTLRDDDVAGRWGGEEFLILLPETAAGEARRVAERIRAAIHATPINLEAGMAAVTITMGVESVDEPTSLETCLRAVDRHLLAGKRAGKNRVHIG